MSDDEVEEEYHSGPYCRHYGDPGNCDETCAAVGCGHSCSAHGLGDEACSMPDCSCEMWTESDETHA